VYRPVAVSASGDRAFEVHNRRSHTNLDDLRGRITLVVGGEVRHESELVVDLAPHARVVVPFGDALLAAVHAAPPHATITLQFRFVSRADSPYAPAGHLVAWDEITLRAPVNKAPPAVGPTGASSVDAPPADAVLAAPMRLALMRAPIDNDGYKLMPGFGEQHRIGGRALARWKRAGILDDEIPAGVLHVQQRELRSDGSVVYRHRVTVPDQHAALPRIGVRFELPNEYGYVRWFGRGPHENYPDRKASAMRDVWAREPDESPYLVPQEFGLRTDCEWVEFVARNSVLRIDVLSPATMNFSAVHHTPSQLYAATDSTQLERTSNLVVHLDVAHRGLGTASCGPDVLPQYEIPAGSFEFSYVVRRI
jgi:beta-galactosidase